jgi:hypothetical protein
VGELATLYSEIFELVLSGFNDYKIDRLFSSATPTSAEVYMTPFLVKAIPNFDNCEQDLEDRNDTTRTFNITLNTDEKVILSELTIVQLLKKEVNDVKQMELHLSDPKAFKHYAEANNLKEKRETMYSAQESAERLMVKYSQKNINWNDYM